MHSAAHDERIARREGLIAINLVAVIFGTAALYGKLDVSPTWITAMRAGFGSLALVLAGGLSTQLLRISRRDWAVITACSFFLGAHWLTFFVSVQLSGVAIATLTFATFPLFTVIVEAASAKRWPGKVEILVCLAIVLAVALLLEPDNDGGHSVGAVAGLSSALSYALFWRVSRLQKKALSAAGVSLCQSALIFVMLAPFLFFSTPPPTTGVQWLGLLGLGVVNTAVLLLGYLYALRRISPSVCSGFVALEPVYAIAFAAVMFGETITPWILVSIVLIIGATLVLLKLENKST